MATKIIRCGHCGKGFPTKVIKVYVFKQRDCPKCKIMTKADYENKLFKCPKCKLEISMDDEAGLGTMPVYLKGTSRDFRVVDAMRRDGFDVVKKLIPKKRYCQKCRNLQSIINSRLRSKGHKRPARELPIHEAAAILRRQVQGKINNDLSEKRRLEEIKEKAKKLKTTKKKALGLTPTELEKKRMEEKKQK